MFDAAHVQMYLHYVMLALSLFLTLGGGTLLVSALTKIPALTDHFFTWASSQAGHVKNQMVAGMLQRALDIVKAVVLKFENTEIESIKSKVASGKISQEDLPGMLAEVKKNAEAAVKDHMTAQGLTADLTKVVFGGSQDGMSKWISDSIEAVVSQLAPSGLRTAKAAGLPTALELAKSIGGVVAKPVNTVVPSP